MCRNFYDAIQCFHNVELKTGYKIFEIGKYVDTGEIIYIPPYNSYPYEFQDNLCVYDKERFDGDGFSFFISYEEASKLFHTICMTKRKLFTPGFKSIIATDTTSYKEYTEVRIILAEVGLFNPSLVLSTNLDNNIRVLGLTPEFTFNKVLMSYTKSKEE